MRYAITTGAAVHEINKPHDFAKLQTLRVSKYRCHWKIFNSGYDGYPLDWVAQIFYPVMPRWIVAQMSKLLQFSTWFFNTCISILIIYYEYFIFLITPKFLQSCHGDLFYSLRTRERGACAGTAEASCWTVERGWTWDLRSVHNTSSLEERAAVLRAPTEFRNGKKKNEYLCIVDVFRGKTKR